MLPPPLTADILPDILVDYVTVAGRGLSPLSRAREEEFGWFTVHAAARYRRARGMLVLGQVTDHHWGRINARESLGFPTKAGAVSLAIEEAMPRAWCGLDGRRVHAIETALTKRPAHPLSLRRAAGVGSFVCRYVPGVDPSQAVVDSPVELWRVSADAAGSESDPDADSAQECDISRTKFTWGPSAWADASLALPAREFVAAAYQELSGEAALAWHHRESHPKQVFLAEVGASRFAPWALSRYDRPSALGAGRPRSSRGRVLLTGKLSSAQVSAYRRREEDELGPMSLVEFRLSIAPERHAEILPPGCEPGRRPLLRLLLLRAEGGDFSARPFEEAWLFAYCRVARLPRWYALSHVAGEDGEMLLGRERFGYPTVEGRVSVGVSPDGFSFSGSRRGREFVRGAGSFRGFSTGLSLSRIHIVALRARPFRPDRPPEAELIEQTWFYQGRRHYAESRGLELEFPAKLEAGGHVAGPPAAPWFEQAPFQVVSAGAMEDAHMQRGLGRVVQAVPDFEPFYRERCDGVLPGEPRPAAGAPSTLRKPPDPRPRS